MVLLRGMGSAGSLGQPEESWLVLMAELGEVALGLILGLEVDWFDLTAELEENLTVVVPDLLKMMVTEAIGRLEMEEGYRIRLAEPVVFLNSWEEKGIWWILEAAENCLRLPGENRREAEAVWRIMEEKSKAAEEVLNREEEATVGRRTVAAVMMRK